MCGGWRRFTTDQRIDVPNTRLVPNTHSPGTPVCHPNDAYRPATVSREQRDTSGAKAPSVIEPSNVRAKARTLHAQARDGEYIELHATSAFSFLAGATLPEQLIQRAVELEMPGHALADRNGVYGAARFHTAAQPCRVKAHIGAEIAVTSLGNPRDAAGMVAASISRGAGAGGIAVRVAGWLPESVPTDYALQDARGDEGGGRGDG